eukprot:TRINITY_DN7971_c0_g1_i4.p1 TRINITY_DN7971_c0_g1~~TRINITY_DN7971_c0_g1_i4.p1  ORF type:complete len:593 (+),score=71.61 TRINITY_DN7971_c0_g1_i4:86-1780(+)
MLRSLVGSEMCIRDRHCTTTSPTLLPTDKMMTTNATNSPQHHESDMLVDIMDETQTMSNTTFLSRHRAPEITRYLAAVCDRLHALIEVGDDTFNLLVGPPSKFFDPQMTSALSAPPAAALGGHAGPVVEEDNIREGAGVRPNVSHIINSVIAASSLHAKKSASITATHHQPWMFTIATDTSLFNSLPPLRDLSSQQQRDTTMIHYPTNDGDQASKEEEESKNASSHRRHIHNRQHQNNMGSTRRRQHSSSPTPSSKVEVHDIVVEKDVFNVEAVEQQHPHNTHQPFSDTLDYFKIKPQPGGVQKQRVAGTALSTYSSHLVSRPNHHHAPTGKPTTVFGQQVLDNDTRTYYGGVIGDGSSEADTSTTTLLTTTPKRMSVPKKSLRRSLVGQSRQNTSSTTTVRPNSAASSTFLMKMLNGRDHDVSIGPSSSSVPTTGLSPLPDVDSSSPCVGEEGVSCSPPPTASSSAIRRGSPERGKRELPFDIVGNEYRNEDRSSLAVATSNREINNNTTITTSVITNHNGNNSSSTAATALKRRPMSAAVAGRHLEASANMRRGRINMHLLK